MVSRGRRFLQRMTSRRKSALPTKRQTKEQTNLRWMERHAQKDNDDFKAPGWRERKGKGANGDGCARMLRTGAG
jgi:hypothetical protein